MQDIDLIIIGGKTLLVDLADRSVTIEPTPIEDALTLIGGYGFGAKFLFLNHKILIACN